MMHRVVDAERRAWVDLEFSTVWSDWQESCKKR